jgi:hypothetical protein
MGDDSRVSERPEVMCLCRVITQRDGKEADEYARDHLVRQSVDSDGWIQVWVCPRSEVKWIMDHPRSEAQGGGPKRLRTFTKVSTEVFAALAYLPSLLPDDAEAGTEASDLRRRLVVNFPGPDPLQQ